MRDLARARECQQDENRGDAGLGLTDALGEGEAAVVEPRTVPHLPATGQGLWMAGREAEPVQEQERVCGRGPLGAVEGVAPLPVCVLGREQSRAPAFSHLRPRNGWNAHLHDRATTARNAQQESSK